MTEEVNTPDQNPQTDDLKQKAQIGYILFVVGVFVGFVAIATVILAYIKRGDAAGTWVESHFNWQIKTFWITLVGGIVGFATLFIWIGIPILIATTIYYIYRTIAGWLKLSENKPAYG